MSVIKDGSDTPRIIFNKQQARKAIQIHPIFISDADNDYILDEIVRRDHIEPERHIQYDDNQHLFIN